MRLRRPRQTEVCARNMNRSGRQPCRHRSGKTSRRVAGGNKSIVPVVSMEAWRRRASGKQRWRGLTAQNRQGGKGLCSDLDRTSQTFGGLDFREGGSRLGLPIENEASQAWSARRLGCSELSSPRPASGLPEGAGGRRRSCWPSTDPRCRRPCRGAVPAKARQDPAARAYCDKFTTAQPSEWLPGTRSDIDILQ